MSIEFKDRIVEYPNRYNMTQNGDGTVTLTPSPGTIVEPGTPLNAKNLNQFNKQLENIKEIATPKIGDIKQFAGSPPDKTWLPCDGDTYNKADYPELHAILSDKDIKQEITSIVRVAGMDNTRYIIQAGTVLYKIYDYYTDVSTKATYSTDGGATWLETPFREKNGLKWVEYYNGYYYFMVDANYYPSLYKGVSPSGRDAVLIADSSKFSSNILGTNSFMIHNNIIIIPGYIYNTNVGKNIYYSTDGGNTFTAGLVGYNSSSNYAVRRVGVANGMFMVRRYYDKGWEYYTSTNGGTWTKINSFPWEKSTQTDATIFVQNDKFVAIVNGIKYTSINGITWATTPVVGITTLDSYSTPLVQGNKVFSRKGRIYNWSLDGIKFYSYTSPTIEDRSDSITAGYVTYHGAYLPELNKAFIRGNTDGSNIYLSYMYQITFNDPYTLDTFNVPNIIDGYSYIKAKEV